MRDYYEVLGVAKDADGDGIKRAYRKLALQFHPDRNGGDKQAEDQFREATEAYEVLRDAQKRAAYDRYGHAGVRGSGGGAGGYGGFNFSDALEIFMRDFGGGGGGGFGVEDLFGMRGGAGGRGRGVRKGADMRVRLSLTFEEVATGARKTIRIDRLDACGKCAGSGAAEGTTPVRCATCGGAGEVQRVQRSFLGQLVSVTPCPECGGEGQRIEKPCTECSGRGVRPGNATIEVNVPPGVSSGDYLTLRGQGNAGVRSGPRGDILVVLDVQEDRRFTRDGADLVYDLAITFSQAALGTDVMVPLVGAPDVKTKIAPGTQSGRILRLRSKGLPHLQSSGRGDLLVRIMVWTPTELTAEQEQLFRKMQQVEAAPPAPGDDDTQRGFWTRMKEAFTGTGS